MNSVPSSPAGCAARPGSGWTRTHRGRPRRHSFILVDFGSRSSSASSARGLIPYGAQAMAGAIRRTQLRALLPSRSPVPAASGPTVPSGSGTAGAGPRCASADGAVIGRHPDRTAHLWGRCGRPRAAAGPGARSPYAARRRAAPASRRGVGQGHEGGGEGHGEAGNKRIRTLRFHPPRRRCIPAGTLCKRSCPPQRADIGEGRHRDRIPPLMACGRPGHCFILVDLGLRPQAATGVLCRVVGVGRDGTGNRSVHGGWMSVSTRLKQCRPWASMSTYYRCKKRFANTLLKYTYTLATWESCLPSSSRYRFKGCGIPLGIFTCHVHTRSFKDCSTVNLLGFP